MVPRIAIDNMSAEGHASVSGGRGLRFAECKLQWIIKFHREMQPTEAAALTALKI